MIDFDAMTTEELQVLKIKNQNLSAPWAGGTMGAKSIARGNVRKINAILRDRGALVDAKARQATKDTTGLVAAAVAPLKNAAVNHAVERAISAVASAVSAYVGKDLNVVAPRPTSDMSRFQYQQAYEKRQYLMHIMGCEQRGYMPHAPFILIKDEAAEARYIESVRQVVAADFDAYVAKLEGKIGQGVTGASVEGRYLWQGSTLTVQKGDVTERWHTQQIVNRSVLGKFFNQWPTRLLK